MLIPLQSYGVFPVFSGFSPDRAIANTGGPWEMAAVAAFLFFYFWEYRYLYLLAFSCAVLVLTESRVTLVATLFSFGVNISRSLSLVFLVLLFLTCALSVILGSMVFSLLPSDWLPALFSERNVIERLISFFSYETLVSVSSAVSSAPAVMTSEEFLGLTLFEKIGVDLEDVGGDPSAIVRFTNWAILLKSVFSSVDSLVIGLGPSFAGKAVDGGFVRLFIETGLLGLVIYVAFIISVLAFSGSRLIFYYFLVLVLSAFFIDIFTTYKAMFLFWVFYGRQLYLKVSSHGSLLRSW